jgi:hypothetical protein
LQEVDVAGDGAFRRASSRRERDAMLAFERVDIFRLLAVASG